MARNTESLKIVVVGAIDRYFRNAPTTSPLEVLKTLEDIRFAVTEELIRQHPEIYNLLAKH